MAPKKVLLSIDETGVTMHGDSQIADLWPNIHVRKILKLSIPDEGISPQILKRRVLQSLYKYGGKIASHLRAIPTFESKLDGESETFL